jgi:glycosyltransferase involved in cell wall biosynthesis
MSDQGTVVIVNYNAGSPRHGPNLRAYYMAKYLVKRGYKVQVFASSFFHKWVELPQVTGNVTPEEIAGAQYNWVRTRPYKGILGRIWSFHQFGWKLPAAIRQQVPEMKALICSSPPPILARVCHRIAKNYGARFLFEVRDIWPLAIIEMGSATRLNPYAALLGWYERYAYKNADMVVSALPCAEPHMTEQGLPEGRFCSIENGIETYDLPEIDECDIAAEVRTPLERKAPFRIGYAGAFDRDNDALSLIHAARLLQERDIEVVLIGKGIRKDQLAAAAADLPNVIILPAVPSAQVPWVLAHFDACYMGLRDKPINMYGVSMAKIFEYLRAARPIVSAVRAGNDIVGDADCGISVTPESAREIADAIVRLVEMPRSERDAMGMRGAAYLQSHHSYDVLTDKWVRVIEGETHLDVNSP